MLRPKAAAPRSEHRADARDVERAARDDRMMIRCAAGADSEGAAATESSRRSVPGEFLSIYLIYYLLFIYLSGAGGAA